jgi:hypothetical protein
MPAVAGFTVLVAGGTPPGPFPCRTARGGGRMHSWRRLAGSRRLRPLRSIRRLPSPSPTLPTRARRWAPRLRLGALLELDPPRCPHVPQRLGRRARPCGVVQTTPGSKPRGTRPHQGWTPNQVCVVGVRNRPARPRRRAAATAPVPLRVSRCRGE